MIVINPSINSIFYYFSLDFELPVLIKGIWYYGIKHYCQTKMCDYELYFKQLLTQYPIYKNSISNLKIIYIFKKDGIHLDGIKIDCNKILNDLRMFDLKKIPQKQKNSYKDWIKVISYACLEEGNIDITNDLLDEILNQNELYGHLILSLTKNISNVVYRDADYYKMFLMLKKKYPLSEEKLLLRMAVLFFTKAPDNYVPREGLFSFRTKRAAMKKAILTRKILDSMAIEVDDNILKRINFDIVLTKNYQKINEHLEELVNGEQKFAIKNSEDYSPGDGDDDIERLEEYGKYVKRSSTKNGGSAYSQPESRAAIIPTTAPAITDANGRNESDIMPAADPDEVSFGSEHVDEGSETSETDASSESESSYSDSE